VFSINASARGASGGGSLPRGSRRSILLGQARFGRSPFRASPIDDFQVEHKVARNRCLDPARDRLIRSTRSAELLQRQVVGQGDFLGSCDESDGADERERTVTRSELLRWLRQQPRKSLELRSLCDRQSFLEEAMMHLRTLATAIFCCATLGTAVGCSEQPTAPTATRQTPDTSSTGASSVAASSQTNVVSPARFGDRTPGVVYVTSQGLYYDTFVVRDPLPMEGRFQLIANGETEFGPGQPGYLGGRWWEDLNDDGIQDPDDHYFLCPLLPPGRSTP
jgi:hypothetical protein